MKTVSLLVKGKVQGVWFRKYTQETAVRLGITGTVENCPDGSVLIHATGTGAQLQELVSWCRTGPPRAEVSAVETKEVPLAIFPDFRIVRHFL